MSPQVKATPGELMAMGEETALDILHAYDPAKRREYYLRTRQLKGRQRGAEVQPSGSRQGGGASNSVLRPSRRKELLAEREKLEKRLDALKEVLREAVKAAKKRAGVEEPKDKEDPKETAAKNEKAKKEKPSKLTEKEKADKRKASKEQYEKEKKTSLATQVEDLHEQLRDTRAKIETALANARKRNKGKSNAQSQSKTQTASKGR